MAGALSAIRVRRALPFKGEGLSERVRTVIRGFDTGGASRAFRLNLSPLTLTPVRAFEREGK